MYGSQHPLPAASPPPPRPRSSDDRAAAKARHHQQFIEFFETASRLTRRRRRPTVSNMSPARATASTFPLDDERYTTCAAAGERPSASDWPRLAGEPGFFRPATGPSPSTPRRSTSTSRPSSRASPAPAGRRTSARCRASRQLRRHVGAGPDSGGLGRRWSCVGGHVVTTRRTRRSWSPRPGRAKGRRARPHDEALGGDGLAGLARRDRLPGKQRSSSRSRRSASTWSGSGPRPVRGRPAARRGERRRERDDLKVAALLSGGRLRASIHPAVHTDYLTSPTHGRLRARRTVNAGLAAEPLGEGADRPVSLRDIRRRGRGQRRPGSIVLA